MPGILVKKLDPPAPRGDRTPGLKRVGSFYDSIRYAVGAAHDHSRNTVDPDAVRSDGTRGRVIRMTGVTSADEAPYQMDAVAERSRAKDSVLHLVVSSGEAISDADMNDAITRILHSIGIDGDAAWQHQCVAVVHEDVEGNHHAHVIINRTNMVSGKALHLSQSYARWETECARYNHERGWRIIAGPHNARYIREQHGLVQADLTLRTPDEIGPEMMARHQSIIAAHAELIERDKGAIPPVAKQAATKRGVLPVAMSIGDVVNAHYQGATTLDEFLTANANSGIETRIKVETGKDGKRRPKISFGYIKAEVGNDGKIRNTDVGTSGSSIGLRAAEVERRFGTLSDRVVLAKTPLKKTKAAARNDQFREAYKAYKTLRKAENAAARSVARDAHRARQKAKIEKVEIDRRQKRAGVMKEMKRGNARSVILAEIDAQAAAAKAAIREAGSTAWAQEKSTIPQKPVRTYIEWLRTARMRPEQEHLRQAEIEAITAKRYEAPSPEIVAEKNVTRQESPPLAVIRSPSPTDVPKKTKVPDIINDPVAFLESMKGQPETTINQAAAIFAGKYGGDIIRGIWHLVGRDHPADINIRRDIAHDLAKGRIDMDAASNRLKAANAEASRPPQPAPPEPGKSSEWQSWKKDDKDKGRG